MNPYVLMAMGCFICTIIQGIEASVSLYDRFKPRSSEANTMSSKGGVLAVAILSIVGTIVTAVIGTALLMYHPKPEAVEKPVVVEKAVPCPPATTGAASTHGAQSPANSGSQNTTTYGATPAQPPPTSPQRK
jgi:hypothetical protein